MRKAVNPLYREQENERIASHLRKKRAKMTECELTWHRKQIAERVRLCRLRKKMPKECGKRGMAENDRGFKTPQSLGKAVKKLQRSLPSSPSKQRVAVAQLARSVGLEVGHTDTQRNSLEKAKPGLREDDIKLISRFYFRTDIVYAMPGINDQMTVWENGIKTRLRKHYLVMFLREAFALFQQCHPNVAVGLSKFCSLRPKNVLLLKHQAADHCKCQIHENFMYKLKGLGICYDDEFWQTVLCDGSYGDFSSLCWRGECEVCTGCSLFVEGSNEKNVCWKEWVKSQDGHLRLVERHTCLGQLKEGLLEDIPFVRDHVRVKRIQAAAFEQDKRNVNGHVLQVDFAMAYSCEYQNEVQSALWSRACVNLFTAALYSKGQACKSFLVVTDCQKKGKDAVFTFIIQLLEYIEVGKDDTFTIFSDGPTSEFKNKFMARLVFLLSKKLQVQVFWKYFATSHGKGVVDGIGGSAKSLVRKSVMSKGKNASIVQNSEDFFKIVSKSMSQVTTIHVTDSEVRKCIRTQNPWQGVKDAIGISKVHMLAYRKGGVGMFKTSKDIEPLGVVEYEESMHNVSKRPIRARKVKTA